STSSARESHEWAAIQAGVFSHEVRSGLYGAADANGDGQVSYREIAAFVQRANASIPNERYRPRVYARPPGTSGARPADAPLLDLRRARKRRALRIAPALHGRYLLETQSGVRVLDFHSAGKGPLTLVRPTSRGLLYLRRLSDEREYTIPATPPVVEIAALTAAKPRDAQRGAAHHAFSQIFARPYDGRAVAQYHFATPAQVAAANQRELDAAIGATDAPRPRWRTVVGLTAIGVSAAALAGGLASTLSALRLRDDIDAASSHARAAALNDSIARRNVAAVVLYSAAGAALAGGLLSLLWPTAPAQPQISLAPRGLSVALGGSF
ncbi:MAG: hypothetical protein KC503_35695, partial [Myxococcales bacterium]|nr:hypothetical protein [Myxococcales bacterium]